MKNKKIVTLVTSLILIFSVFVVPVTNTQTTPNDNVVTTMGGPEPWN